MVTTMLAALFWLFGPSPAAASGACCGGVAVTDDGGKGSLTAAAFFADARSVEGFGHGEYVFDQTGAGVRASARVYRRLSLGLTAGGLIRSKLRGGDDERSGSGGYFYGAQLGGPVWLDAERELDVTLTGGWSRAEGDLDSKRLGGVRTSVDQKVQVEEFTASLVGSKCFGLADVSAGARWFNGHTEVRDKAGEDHLAGHRDGHFAGLLGTRIHLGSERRSLALELGLGAVRTLSAGFVFSF